MSTSSWAEGPRESFASGLSMGMLEAKRGDVLRALQLRFRSAVPPESAAAVRAMDDLDRLDRWFDAALTAPCWDSFRNIVTHIDDAVRLRSVRDQ